MRVSETRYRWEFQLVEGETVADYQTLADVEPLIRPWLGDTPADALELVRVTAYTFRAQVANRWRDRNVFLLGDAAHLTPPFVGQGMAAGLRDALNLTWKLVGVLDGTLPESVLDTYEQERKLHAAAMILMAVSVGAAMTGGGRVGDLIRHVVFPRMQNLRLPGTRVSAADGVAPGLRSSELVIKSRTPGGLAGTLCPNPVLQDGLRFDEVVGNRFALITSSPLTDAQRNELSSRGAAVVLAAPGSELDGWLRKGRASAAIVRPDRAVMQAGRSVEAICEPCRCFTESTAPVIMSATDRCDSTDVRTEPPRTGAISNVQSQRRLGRTPAPGRSHRSRWGATRTLRQDDERRGPVGRRHWFPQHDRRRPIHRPVQPRAAQPGDDVSVCRAVIGREGAHVVERAAARSGDPRGGRRLAVRV